MRESDLGDDLDETRTEPPQLSFAVGRGTAIDVAGGPVYSRTIGPDTPTNKGGAVSGAVIQRVAAPIPESACDR